MTLEDTVRHPVRMQQAVRWSIVQLAQATWRAEGAGVPAKGLTGDAYDGHYFWDTETLVLPFLAYTQPRIARNLLRFRHSMLPSARSRAGELNLRGALFPWRTIRGDEASAYYQGDTAQFHLNADIADAIRRYVDVRGDVGFLLEVGAEILVETARMWTDLGFYGGDGGFHLHGVTGPDEYTTMVDDNADTNLMARLNLRYAATTMRRLEHEHPDEYAGLAAELSLDPAELVEWERAAEWMYVPHDPETGITPQDATFLSHEPWDLDGEPPERFPLLLHPTPPSPPAIPRSQRAFRASSHPRSVMRTSRAVTSTWRSSWTSRTWPGTLDIRLAHDVECYTLSAGDPLDVVIRGERHLLTRGAPLELGRT